MKTPKPRYAILLPEHFTYKPCEDSTFAELRVVLIDTEDGRERVRNTRDTGFDDLVFRCWMSWRHDKFEVSMWHPIEYRSVYTVDLDTAERMFKMLRKISKLELPVQPETFGQYVALVSPLIGINEIAIPDANQNTMRSYDDNHYEFQPIKYAQYRVDRLIAELKERVLPTSPKLDDCEVNRG